MRVRAPAKLNPFLSVGSLRADGYHEIESVMQSVSLYDTLTLAPAHALAIEDPLGLGPSNLALRAASALGALHGGRGAALSLSKSIPVAAGLGGGSADAAAALVGCNALWGLNVSRKALEKIGATIGADVPFCVRGGTAAVRGIGETMSSLPVRAPVWWVLGTSHLALSTAAVYAEFDRLGGGEIGDPYEVADALARGDLARLAESLRNDLQPAALSLHPSLDAGRRALIDAGALAVVLAGSGPTWCALCSSEAHAREVAARAAAAFVRAEVVHSVDHGARIEIE
jgi:4-diphosphocytidyl-2-C-methyl-D-erythritol kinase